MSSSAKAGVWTLVPGWPRVAKMFSFVETEAVDLCATSFWFWTLAWELNMESGFGKF